MARRIDWDASNRHAKLRKWIRENGTYSWLEDLPPHESTELDIWAKRAVEAAGVAIDFYEKIGWHRVRAANTARMRYGRDLVMAELGVGKEELREEELPLGVVRLHKIEVPITTACDQYFMRISGQLYNDPADYEKLALAVRTEFN